jgi:hypothetical protein
VHAKILAFLMEIRWSLPVAADMERIERDSPARCLHDL